MPRPGACRIAVARASFLEGIVSCVPACSALALVGVGFLPALVQSGGRSVALKKLCSGFESELSSSAAFSTSALMSSNN